MKTTAMSAMSCSRNTATKIPPSHLQKMFSDDSIIAQQKESRPKQTKSVCSGRLNKSSLELDEFIDAGAALDHRLHEAAPYVEDDDARVFRIFQGILERLCEFILR